MDENRAQAPGFLDETENSRGEVNDIRDIISDGAIEANGNNSSVTVDIQSQITEENLPGQVSDTEEIEKLFVADSKQLEKDPVKPQVNHDNQNAQPQIGFFHLFRYAGIQDFILVAFGTMCAAIYGVSLPILIVFVGDFTTELVSFGRYSHCNYNYYQCNSTLLGNLSKTEFDESILLENGGRLDLNESLARYALYLTVTGLVIWLACAGQVIAWTLQASRQVKKIRLLFFESVLKQDVAFFDANSAAGINMTLAQDMRKIQDGIGDKMSMTVVQLTRLIACLAVGMTYSWKVTLVMMGIIPCVIMCGSILVKFMSWFSIMESTAYVEAGEIAEEILSAMRTIMVFGAEKREIRRYCNSFHQATGKGIAKGFIQGSSVGIIYFILFSIYALLFSFGSGLVLQGELLVGSFLTAFLTMFVAAFALIQSISCIDSVNIARLTAAKVFASIDRESLIDSFSDEGHRPDKIVGKIEIKNINFSYPTRSNVKVLDDLSFVAEPGKTTAICGKSGCGKSTIIQLLQRFYDPQEGTIELDGVDIRTLNVEWLRDNIGVVSQNAGLFDTSIMENIRYGRSNVSDEQVIEAAKKANAFDFISELPNKFETLLGEGGTEISGGQRQRIAIARAVVGEPKILLFDEVSGSLDIDGERLVQATANIVSKGTTAIIITHRITMVRKAHKIIALDGGKIVEQGNHQLLNSAKGLYKNLVELHRKEFEQSDKPENHEVIKAPSDANQPIKRQVTSILSQPVVERSVNIKEEPLPQASFMKIVNYSKSEIPFLLIGSFFALVSGAILPCFAILYAEFLKMFLFHTTEQQYIQFSYDSFLLLILGSIAMLSNTAQITCFFYSGEALTSRLRSSAMRTILSQRMCFFDEPGNSKLLLGSRLSVDAARVKDCTGVRIGSIIQSVCGLVVGFVIAFVYGWRLTLIIMLFIPIILAAGVFQIKTLTEQLDQEEKDLTPALKIVAQYTNNIKTVVSLSREKQFLHNYKLAMAVPQQGLINKLFFHAVSYGFSQCLLFIILAVLCKFGAWLVQGEYMYFEDVFKVTLAVMFAVMAMAELSGSAPDYAAAINSATKMFKLLENAPSKNDAKKTKKKLETKKGRVEYEDVYFSYPTSPENEILKGLSLEIEPGSTMALVGESGCGKSTCIQLLERFYDPSKGSVLYEDTNITDYDIPSVRASIGVVSQETVLFNCSVADNIRFGDLSRDVTLEEIIYQTTNADIHDFVQSLPDGYDTNIGPNGIQLSAGQRQRIAIARAMLRNPKLLLLDEATSSLDIESEVAVHDALDVARQGRTTIIIAQRFSAVKDADVIAVISDGVIVEIGTNAELLSDKGLYLDLVNKQIYSTVA